MKALRIIAGSISGILSFLFLVSIIILIFNAKNLTTPITIIMPILFFLILIISCIFLILACIKASKKKFKTSIIVFSLGLLIGFLSNPINQSLLSSQNWRKEDFSFYNTNRKVILTPSAEDYWVRLQDAHDAMTFRGIMIGDPISDIKENHSLMDMEWSICDFSKLNPSTDAAESFETNWKDKGMSTKDIIDSVDIISANSLDVYLWVDVYKQNGKFLTYSQLDKSVLEKNYSEYGERKEWFFLREHLYCTISFSIKNGIVSDVSIENNYYNNLSSAYDRDGNLRNGYEWIEKLR